MRLNETLITQKKFKHLKIEFENLMGELRKIFTKLKINNNLWKIGDKFILKKRMRIILIKNLSIN